MTDITIYIPEKKDIHPYDAVCLSMCLSMYLEDITDIYDIYDIYHKGTKIKISRLPKDMENIRFIVESYVAGLQINYQLLLKSEKKLPENHGMPGQVRKKNRSYTFGGLVA